MDVFGPKAAKYDADMRPTHAVSTKVMTGSHKTAASAGTANFTICLNVSAGKSISFSFLLLWTTSDDRLCLFWVTSAQKRVLPSFGAFLFSRRRMRHLYVAVCSVVIHRAVSSGM